MNIEITEHAYADLQDIYSYIAYHDSVESSDHVLDNIYERIRSLAELPLRGTQVKELVALGNKDYKEVYFKPYRIIYKVLNTTVYIVAVGDGRRDFKTLLERRLLLQQD